MTADEKDIRTYRLKQYYCPEKIRVGMYTGVIGFTTGRPQGDRPETTTSQYGKVTFRVYGEEWADIKRFEDTVGYRPSCSSDKVIELEKDLSGKIRDFDNVPTEGFQIVGKCHGGGIALKDPRGFIVAMPNVWLRYMIVDFDADIVGGFIKKKLVYCWINAGKCCTLLADDSIDFLEATDMERSVTASKNTILEKSVKPSEFVPGHIYNFNKISKGMLEKKKDLHLYVGNVYCFSPSKLLSMYKEGIFRSYEFVLVQLKQNRDQIQAGKPAPWRNLIKTVVDVYDGWKKRNVFLRLRCFMDNSANGYIMEPRKNPDWIFMNKFIDEGIQYDNFYISCIDTVCPSSSSFQIQEYKGIPACPRFPVAGDRLGDIDFAAAFKFWQETIKFKIENLFRFLPPVISSDPVEVAAMKQQIDKVIERTDYEKLPIGYYFSKSNWFID